MFNASGSLQLLLLLLFVLGRTQDFEDEATNATLGETERLLGSRRNLRAYPVNNMFTEYHCHERACVNGNNYLIKRAYSREKCAWLCDARGSACKGFEYGVNYGGSGTGHAKTTDCLLKSSADYGNCDGTHKNTDLCLKSREKTLEKYTCHKRSCVNGMDIKKFSGYTREQCAQECDNYPDCRGFEYGVNYGSPGRADHKATECTLQAYINSGNCDGTYWNKDLCLKN
jgi:hypothetical protein